MLSSSRSAAPNTGARRRTSPPRLPGNTLSTSASAAIPCCGAEPHTVARPSPAFDDRMADTGARQPLALEIGRLERQERQQVIVPPRHPPRPARPPGPDHRGDVMDERERLAGTAQSMRDPPGKTRAVDRHDRVGPRRADRRRRLADVTQDRRRPRQNLGDTGHREIAERDEAFQPLFRHPLAADPGDFAAARRCARAAPRSAPRRAHRPKARR